MTQFKNNYCFFFIYILCVINFSLSLSYIKQCCIHANILKNALPYLWNNFCTYIHLRCTMCLCFLDNCFLIAEDYSPHSSDLNNFIHQCFSYLRELELPLLLLPSALQVTWNFLNFHFGKDCVHNISG